jgi:hypothetical protein
MFAVTAPLAAALFSALALAPAPALAAQYGLVKSYQGQNFFNDWIFYNKIDDLTQGNVMCVPTPRPPAFRSVGG